MIEVDGMQQGCKAANHSIPAACKQEGRNSCTQFPFFYLVQDSSQWDNVMHIQGKPSLIRYIVLETTSQTYPEECQHDNSFLISLKQKCFTLKDSVLSIVPKISVSSHQTHFASCLNIP